MQLFALETQLPRHPGKKILVLSHRWNPQAQVHFHSERISDAEGDKPWNNSISLSAIDCWFNYVTVRTRVMLIN